MKSITVIVHRLHPHQVLHVHDPHRAVLSVHHGQKAVLLVDEYDACVLNAWEHGYYDDAVAFFRGLLSPGLKDNPFLFKGVLTGILRVSRESMFSGLNNVKVYSLLDRDR
ncbi:MAG: AAA family ATPase, partial [Planctomycetota bacterium]